MEISAQHGREQRRRELADVDGWPSERSGWVAGERVGGRAHELDAPAPVRSRGNAAVVGHGLPVVAGDDRRRVDRDRRWKQRGRVPSRLELRAHVIEGQARILRRRDRTDRVAVVDHERVRCKLQQAMREHAGHGSSRALVGHDATRQHPPQHAPLDLGGLDDDAAGGDAIRTPCTGRYDADHVGAGEVGEGDPRLAREPHRCDHQRAAHRHRELADDRDRGADELDVALGRVPADDQRLDRAHDAASHRTLEAFVTRVADDPAIAITRRHLYFESITTANAGEPVEPDPLELAAPFEQHDRLATRSGAMDADLAGHAVEDLLRDAALLDREPERRAELRRRPRCDRRRDRRYGAGDARAAVARPIARGDAAHVRRGAPAAPGARPDRPAGSRSRPRATARARRPTACGRYARARSTPTRVVAARRSRRAPAAGPRACGAA